MRAGHNVFLTGSAGTGKTFLLDRFIRYLRLHDIKVAVTASTGIAAAHLGGRTIHSWASMGIDEDMGPKQLKRLSNSQEIRERIRSTKVLIIDEISMLDAKRLDLVDKICRFFKDPFVPFGGIQVILCGDFFQLPPIFKDEPVRLAYDSYAWQEADLKTCYLTKQYRHSDPKLISILNRIRQGLAGDKELTLLASRIDAPGHPDIAMSRLYTHNADVDVINRRELARLEGEGRAYRRENTGPKELTALLSRTYLVPDNLELKIGAVVMFVKNNFDAGYVNGTLGKVISFSPEGYPIVQTWDGQVIEAMPGNWNLEDDDGKIIAALRQLPLRLAWAITIHKSQGMSLDGAEMDLSKCFAPGMGYVALSRVRSLSGMRILGISPFALKIDGQVGEKDRYFQALSIEADKAL